MVFVLSLGCLCGLGLTFARIAGRKEEVNVKYEMGPIEKNTAKRVAVAQAYNQHYCLLPYDPSLALLPVMSR